jgi:hypothetical protein
MNERVYETEAQEKRRNAGSRPGAQQAETGSLVHGLIDVAGVLRLQRLAGNASVATMLVPSANIQRSAPVAEKAGPASGTAEDTQRALAPPAVATVAPAAAGPATTEALAAPQTPEQVAAGKPLLALGSTGPAVTELQTGLNLAGAQPKLKVDGIFGPKTQRAVRKYQAMSGLTADQLVGGKTWLGLGVYKETRSNADKDRKEALDKITITTVGHGSSGAAVAAAKTIQEQEWLNLDLAGLKQLAGSTIELHIIPHKKKMTDLDEFKDLKGQTTFDGRLWDDVRGINMGKDGDKIRSAVGEEALIDIKGEPTGYGPGFVAAHETGHAVKNALTPAQLTKLTAIFAERVAAHAPPAQNADDDDFWLQPSWYTGANEDEYLASSTAAYLSHPYTTAAEAVKKYTPGWLAANDAKMYEFLKTVF